MHSINNATTRTLAQSFAGATLILLMTMGGASASAQNLQSVVCPAGPPNYAPFGLSAFSAVGSSGAPLLRHTLQGVDSLCNDDTQAVIYIRPAEAQFSGYWDNPEDPADPLLASDRWVIWFHGGGGCRSEDDCLARWCSAPGSRAFDRAGKMSTRDAHEAIKGQGIFKRRSDNTFAGYNQVLLNYCSSDNWIGSDTKVAVAASNGMTFDISFSGEAIVNDAINALLTGVTPDSNAYWTDPMPLLTSATEIVFVGDSAGGGGLRHHIDRLVDELTPQLSAEATIHAVVDAGVTPALWRPAINWALAPVANYADYLVGPVNDGIVFWGADTTAIDDSCQDPANAAAHVAIGGSHPEVCYDTTFTLLHHISTPFFVGMDINDTLGRERYDNWGLLTPPPLFWAAQYAQLDALATGGTPAYATPGVFGPKCNQHVRVTDQSFFSQSVVLPGGALGSSYHDLLVNWLTGAAPVSELQQDGFAGPGYTPSNCP